MVKLRKDAWSMPFPRRVSGWERDRFWRKLQEDIEACKGVMPTISEFYRKFSDLTYRSFYDALRNFKGFREACCRGEEYKIPDKYLEVRN